MVLLQSPMTALHEARMLVEIFPHRFEAMWFCSALAAAQKQARAMSDDQ